MTTKSDITFTSRRHRKVVVTVGEINTIWDDIELALWYIFDANLNVSWQKSYSIFFSQQNHRARREMVEALMDATWKTTSEKHKKFTALMQRLKRAASKRNSLTHGVWTLAKVGRKLEVHRIPLKRKVPELMVARVTPKDLVQIRNQIFKLYLDLWDYAHPPWAEKTSRLKEGKSATKS